MAKAPFKSRMKNGVFATMMVATVGTFEGVRTVAYLDPVNIPTICFGETKGVKLGMKKTMAECQGMLTESLITHEKGMVACLSNPDALPDKTYGAFLSFTYNLGVGAFCGSTMRKKVNAGDLRGACNELPKWNKATVAPGVRIVLPGLTIRRGEERGMCLDGIAA